MYVPINEFTMSFIIVQFTEAEGGGISVIHKNWLTPRKSEVFWPPFKDQSQYNKALKKGEPVNTETWKIFKVVKCFYSTGKFVYKT